MGFFERLLTVWVFLCIASCASWERGANENMNGLIRQFFPKKMGFDREKSPN